MALFKRRRADQDAEPRAATPEDALDARPPAPAEAPDGRGPHDSADRPETAGLMDFGAIRLPIDPEAQVTVEVARETNQPVAVVVAIDGSRMRLTALAAPRTGGLWETVMRDEQSALTREGATVRDADGPFGPELVAQIPSTTAQGRQGKQVLRLIGADGPRWLLRATIAGKAARDREAGAALEEMFANIVVARGSVAMPPREPLPLRLPTARSVSDEAEHDADRSRDADPRALLERGPEITEVR